MYVFQGEALISKGVVASGSSATIVSLNLSSVIYLHLDDCVILT